MEYDSKNWCDLNWSEWLLFSENFRKSDTSKAPGIYKIKEITTGKLMYVGQTGNLRQRIGALRNNTLKDEAPWNDPHTAAPRLWSYTKEMQWSFASSVAECSSEERARKMLECAVISACRSETEFSPICNFGRMHPKWSKPTNKKGGRACKRAEVGLSSNFAESIAYSTYPKLKYREWGSNPWVKSHRSAIDYDGQALYFLIGDGEVVYIGQSENLKQRMPSHAKKCFESVLYHPLPDNYLNSQRFELENDLLAEFWGSKNSIPQYQFSNT